MARLNKTQIYAIRWLDSQGKNIDQISDELDIPSTTVKKTVEKNSSAKSDDKSIKTAKEPVSKSQNLMIRETASKKTKNVSIMTKEASELNDQIKNQAAKHPLTEKAIFRPRQ